VAKDKKPVKEKNSNQDRRRILKTTLAGGAVISTSVLPDSWKKPAVDHIILPAHADTTEKYNNITYMLYTSDDEIV